MLAAFPCWFHMISYGISVFFSLWNWPSWRPQMVLNYGGFFVGHELFPKKRWGETQPTNIGPGMTWGSPFLGDLNLPLEIEKLETGKLDISWYWYIKLMFGTYTGWWYTYQFQPLWTIWKSMGRMTSHILWNIKKSVKPPASISYIWDTYRYMRYTT